MSESYCGGLIIIRGFLTLANCLCFGCCVEVNLVEGNKVLLVVSG